MKIEKLGPITEGELKLNNMTVFIGESGSGKTYMSYVIYAIHKHIENEITKLKLVNDENFQELLENKELIIDIDAIIKQVYKSAEKSFQEKQKQILGSTFNSPSKMFEETKLDIDYNDFPGLKVRFLKFFFLDSLPEVFFKLDDAVHLLSAQIKDNEVYISLNPIKMGELPLNRRFMDNKKVLKNTLNRLLNQCFTMNRLVYIPAERVGLHVFRGELNKGRLDDFADLSLNSSQYREKFERDNINIPTYPEPISSYLNNLNQWFSWSKLNYKLEFSEDFRIDSIVNELLNGKFEINDKEDVFFRERFGKVRYKSQKIPLQISSSTLKSLFGLDLYLKTGLIQSGEYLVIDEPELNLHVKSQKILASLLYKLMENGIYVILSTHSDYLVRELVNLELKNQVKENEKVNHISCYYFSDNTINELPSLTDVNYIENFDDSFIEVENEYYKLLSKVEKLKNEETS
ncbi:AAA family ATPase [Carnobacterium maltaromaticum]|uniref:AAA family ATPase n=1 Tax=Carnobacterium maltaromaticum TaxID=2751 RepID=UPI0039BE654D